MLGGLNEHSLPLLHDSRPLAEARLELVSLGLQVLDDSLEVGVDELHLVILVFNNRLVAVREIHLILRAEVRFGSNLLTELVGVLLQLFDLLHVSVEAGHLMRLDPQMHAHIERVNLLLLDLGLLLQGLLLHVLQLQRALAIFQHWEVCAAFYCGVFGTELDFDAVAAVNSLNGWPRIDALDGIFLARLGLIPID